MANEDQPEKVWDEYDWERFLQQQDRKTEKYMELQERFMDHPERDQIIAREMGWHHLLNSHGESWADQVDLEFLAELQEESGIVDDDEVTAYEEGDEEGELVHPLYECAFTLAVWVGELLDNAPEPLRSHPAAIRLSTHADIAGQKLAAALSDDDVDELGMTIAYLKRALGAVTVGLSCASDLLKGKLLTPDQFGLLNGRLFQVRDGIITLMGEFRAEWRRRYEH